ncbi:unnamed protein product [Cuscuta epithymum]|uniref:Uncharacterized protein n=1 Tax=Cuscuta epithymum TaxID=186058 RepID=A0AAV0DE85_9ASTE|nr:unnamed protein product [Cuscuta epithymum]
MGALHEQLDEAFAEIEKLKTENKIKAESCESFKRAYNEQLIKSQTLSSELAKITLLFDTKVEELSLSNQRYEELKSNVKEKEAAITHLSQANDRLRTDSAQKLKELEEANTSISMALDEANARNMDQEQKIESFRDEIERLRELAMASAQKTSSEVKKGKKVYNELREKDDVMLKLEQENMKLEEELKWKKEKYDLLIQAHEKIKKQFHQKEKEWKQEKDTLYEEISTLQVNLDSQSRCSEDLQNRLNFCKQALDSEENKRKSMEVQLSESKTWLDNVSAEYEEAKSRIISLTNQRDKEIEKLREASSQKDKIYKEMDYKSRKLERENQELMASLKELQEAGIKEAGIYSSSSKLKNKFKAKEAEWASKLKSKDNIITMLHDELQASHSFVNSIEEQKILLQIEADILKETLKEAMEQLVKTNSELQEVNSELKQANEELEENFYKSKEIEFELQIWRSLAERLKSRLDENHQMRKEVEASLFDQVDVEIELRRDRESLIQILAEKEEEVNELKEKIKKRAFQETFEWFEEDWLRKELEKAILTQVEEEMNCRRIDDLQKLVRTLEMEFQNSTSSFSSRLVDILETTVKEAVVSKEKNDGIASDLERNFDVCGSLRSKLVGVSDKMSQMWMEDLQLGKKLERIVEKNSSRGGFDEWVDDHPTKENTQSLSPTKIGEASIMPKERLPFRTINN